MAPLLGDDCGKCFVQLSD